MFNNRIVSYEFEKQGHRGCSGLMPENTIAAMLHAVSLGVTNLELDVVLTRDDKVVVSHDPFLNHVIATKPGGSYVTREEENHLIIRGMTYDELRLYDVGKRPVPEFPYRKNIPAVVPLLSDVFDSVGQYCKENALPPVKYNIEIKSAVEDDGKYYNSVEQYADLIMSVIEKRQVSERVVLISFDERALQYIHSNYELLKTGLISYDMSKASQEIESLGFLPQYYSPAYTTVASGGVQHLHQKGVKVIPWTVNTKEEIEQLLKMGVDGIITDYPNLF